MIRIDEINKAGGLLGKQIKVVTADTKTDRAEGAKAGLEVLDKGAELVIVSCDYDFGAPAALAAEAAGKVSFFLCAESIKAGIPGVGPHSLLGLGAGGRAGRHHGANGPTRRRTPATSTACSTPGPSTTRASAMASTG